MAMAMAAVFRREGRRRAAPLMTGHSINPIRSSTVPSEEQAAFGVRFISSQTVRANAMLYENMVGILKAINIFAASKVEAIQTETENSRRLFKPFTALLGDTPSVDVRKNVIVTIASDNGLCGETRALNEINSGPGKESKYVILGEKAKAQLIDDSKKHIELSITLFQNNPLNYTQVANIADEILKNVKNKNVEYDALRVVFNKFQSIGFSTPTTSTVLSPEVVEIQSEAGGTLGEFDSYEIKGGGTKSEVLQNLTEFRFSCATFNAIWENACSVQGARASFLDGETRSTFEELNLLTDRFNRSNGVTKLSACELEDLKKVVEEWCEES